MFLKKLIAFGCLLALGCSGSAFASDSFASCSGSDVGSSRFVHVGNFIAYIRCNDLVRVVDLSASKDITKDVIENYSNFPMQNIAADIDASGRLAIVLEEKKAAFDDPSVHYISTRFYPNAQGWTIALPVNEHLTKAYFTYDNAGKEQSCFDTNLHSGYCYWIL